MKILGETSGGFIVEISNGELANLVGIHSEYNDEFRKLKSNGIVGKTLDVCKIFTGYKTLKELREKKKSILQTISDLSDSVSSINEVKLVDEETTKKEK